jgi:putative CocE/NonD family hydrolase
MKLIKLTILILPGLLCTLLSGAEIINDSLTYSKNEVMIPMRDGTKLFTVIYTPEKAEGALPFLIYRTPYGASKMVSPEKITYIRDMAIEGYIFVFQDIRGRYRSEGTFALQDLYRENKEGNTTDESTDAFDTIEWLLKKIPGNNGKAGIYGVSAVGSTALLAAIGPHPALKAVSEQAAGFVNLFVVDDFYHNGAFRLSYSFEYAYYVENEKENALFPFDKYDTYDWYLNLGPLSNVNKNYFHDRLPSWNNYANHQTLDDFWKRQSLVYHLSGLKVPLLHVAGWWDQEDFCGPLLAYEALEKNDINSLNFIAIGPWNHGGWQSGTGESLGNIDFGTPTGEYFRHDIQAPFFAWYLKGKGNGHFPEAVTFQTGSNKWMSYEKWPPVEKTVNRNIYLHAKGALSFDPPEESDSFDTFLSDPDHPVPYRPRPIESTYGQGSRWFTWLVEDQRFVNNRPDVASWESAPLKKDVEVTGNIEAVIFASTSGTDADWIVKLIDVYPEVTPEKPRMGGYQLMIANDVLRGRFCYSFTDPEPVKPGEVNEYTIDLHSINHVFKTGHKIMVQVQSSWFPIISLNPQKYIPNIFDAKEEDFITANQKIFRSAGYPSHIVLPLIENK